MKKAELMQLVESGAIIVVGDYWGGRVDKISVRDRQNPGGPRRDAYVTRETVLTDKEPVAVARWLTDTEKPEDWKPSAKKRDRVVVMVSSMETQNGAVVLGGRIEVLV